MRAVLSITALAAVATLAACSDGHEYPSGFAQQAARDEAWFKEQEKAQASGQSSETQTAKAGAGATASAGYTSTSAPGSGMASSAPTAPVESALVADATADVPTDDSAEPPEVSEERAAAADARRIYTELRLPSPPPVEVAQGEEPFMKLARERKFDEFRRMCARYLQLKRELLPYGELLASGESTARDREIHAKIERAMEAEFPRINRYMWDDRWTELDRAAMGWILNGSFAKQPG